MKQNKAITMAVDVAVCLAAGSLSSVAYAQASAPPSSGNSAVRTAQNANTDELQEIVVTAERRTSDVQRTAVSISVRQGETMLRAGRTTTQQILEDVPGVTLSTTPTPPSGADNQGSQYVIRGVASNGTPTGQIIATVPTTAIYVDGVYEGVGGNYDIDRVEVLRGPQGTLYGRSATSGVVSTYTADPKLGRFGGNAAAEIGNYSLEHYTGAVNLPLGDTLALRVSADSYKHDGYYGKDGAGAIRSTNAKAKLLYKPNDDFSVLFGYALQDNRAGTGGPQGQLSYGNYDAVN
jgi:outer membrane receptor protein involved in Fe transport